MQNDSSDEVLTAVLSQKKKQIEAVKKGKSSKTIEKISAILEVVKNNLSEQKI